MAESDLKDEEGGSAGDSADVNSNNFGTYNLPTDLTAFQIHLLCLIARLGPTEGMTLQDALEALYPEAINHGRLYPKSRLDG